MIHPHLRCFTVEETRLSFETSWYLISWLATIFPAIAPNLTSWLIWSEPWTSKPKVSGLKPSRPFETQWSEQIFLLAQLGDPRRSWPHSCVLPTKAAVKYSSFQKGKSLYVIFSNIRTVKTLFDQNIFIHELSAFRFWTFNTAHHTFFSILEHLLQLYVIQD